VTTILFFSSSLRALQKEFERVMRKQIRHMAQVRNTYSQAGGRKDGRLAQSQAGTQPNKHINRGRKSSAEPVASRQPHSV
jgi:hypothetical protein